MKKFLDIIFGMIIIVYIAVINIISSSKISFSIPIFILGVTLIIYHFIKRRIESNKLMYRYFKVLKVLICIGVIFFLGIEIFIINYPKYNKGNADYIIVLGAGLDTNSNPSLILQGRLDAALEYIKEDDYRFIVLSGGQGSDEKLPESHAMKKYLLDRGVDEKKVIIEDKSRNTDENFKFSKVKIEENSGRPLDKLNIEIVTSDFHALRSSILAKKNGYVNYSNYSSHTVWYLIPITYTREAFAIVKSIIFD
ncbi:YdcF family protein [Candidatus Clostridium helianthi]|uniref:YdcF family protein n=1 Tax=Candidatus Clostridium helianthi TaxID=3381660 RepID=A0ABW8S4E7_9CLOT